MFIDTHAHLDFPEYDKDREGVIRHAQQEGVEYIINVGTGIEASRRSIELSRKYDFIYAGVAVHPHHAHEIDSKGLSEIEELARSPKVVAIGETGLDFYKNLSPAESQEKIFRYSIGLARKLELALIVHSREAADATLRILKQEGVEKLRGVLHCYSYPDAIAREILGMGFYISVAGQVTFPNARSLREIVRNIPPEKMLLETDCPFLAPQKFRGKRNEPGYVRYIAEELGRIYGLGIEEIARITSKNAKNLFNLNG